MSYSTKLVPGLWRFTVRRNGIPWVERADESAREQDLLDEFGRCAANLREGAAQYFNREQLLLTNCNKTKHGTPRLPVDGAGRLAGAERLAVSGMLL